MLDTNIIKVSLKTSKKIRTIPLHRWDTGMELQFEGVEIPLNTTCQFETGNGEAILQLVDSETGRVDIPNSLLNEDCFDDIRAHLYIATAEFGMTVYDIVIPVIMREPPAEHISPDNSQTIEEWISEQVELVAADREAIENMSATASVDATTGTPSVTVTKSTILDHENLDFAFSGLKGDKGDTGAAGKDGKDGADGKDGDSIGTVTASVDANTGTPSVTVTQSGGSGSPINVSLAFHNLKGEAGSLPAYTYSDSDKILKVNDSGNGIEWGTVGTVFNLDTYRNNPIPEDVFQQIFNEGKGERGKRALFAWRGMYSTLLYPDLYDMKVIFFAQDGFEDEMVVCTLNRLQTVQETKYVVPNIPQYSALEETYHLYVAYDDGEEVYKPGWADMASILPKELPAVTSADNGMVLGVSSGAWNKVTAPKELPTVTSADEGKVLSVNSNGVWVADDVPEELPAVSAADNGKVLGVDNGAWGAVTPSGGGGVTVDLLVERNNYDLQSGYTSITLAHPISDYTFVYFACYENGNKRLYGELMYVPAMLLDDPFCENSVHTRFNQVNSFKFANTDRVTCGFSGTAGILSKLKIYGIK